MNVQQGASEPCGITTVTRISSQRKAVNSNCINRRIPFAKECASTHLIILCQEVCSSRDSVYVCKSLQPGSRIRDGSRPADRVERLIVSRTLFILYNIPPCAAHWCTKGPYTRVY
ncbi:hypothetical protein BJ165DRAFT_1468666 [Panaeolus papilionaceus]|nr:hypothetical protein BJ165DRAFT_1468666 [Panaeolus papilionaceus]